MKVTIWIKKEDEAIWKAIYSPTWLHVMIQNHIPKHKEMK